MQITPVDKTCFALQVHATYLNGYMEGFLRLYWRRSTDTKRPGGVSSCWL